MIGKRNSVVIMILATFVFSLATVMHPRATPSYPPVRIYIDPDPIPFATPGTKITFIIKINTTGIPDWTVGFGITQWSMDIRVDPNVLGINTTVGAGCGCPPCCPPIPGTSEATFSTEGTYFMRQYATYMAFAAPSLFFGTNDPAAGEQISISEVDITGSWTSGPGDWMSTNHPNLLKVEMTSKSNTKGTVIDLIKFKYRTADGVWHFAEQVEDGYYGTPPPTIMSHQGGLLPSGDPQTTSWHEIYPTYCQEWDLTSWVDNGDGYLSASDQIDMTQTVGSEVGWIYWYHVDVVTTTIHWTFKDPVVGSGEAEPVEPFLLDDIMTNPIGSYWHQLYPEYSRYFKITSWDDNSGEPDTDPNGVFDPSDQFDFIYLDDDPPVTVWAHLDEVTTDIILSFKEKEAPVPEFPFGVNLLMLLAPIVPLIYLWRLRKKVAKQ